MSLYRLAAELKRISDMQGKHSPRQWAYDLQEREKAGDRLTKAQRDMWREALLDAPVGNLDGAGFNPILFDKLPPGMRPRDAAAVTEDERMAA